MHYGFSPPPFRAFVHTSTYSACCPTCQSLYSQPGAKLFAACGTADPVFFKSKVSRAIVGPGKKVKYAAKIVNRSVKPLAAQGFGFAVLLPEGSILVSRTRLRRNMGGAVVKTSNSMVAWEGFTLARGQGLKLKLVVRVRRGVSGGGTATFEASLYRVLPDNGGAYCPNAHTWNETVRIKARAAK